MGAAEPIQFLHKFLLSNSLAVLGALMCELKDYDVAFIRSFKIELAV